MNNRTEYYDGTFIHATMAFSMSTELLVISFYPGSMAHILYWDWYAEDYDERFVDLSDINLSERPAGFRGVRYQAAGVGG